MNQFSQAWALWVTTHRKLIILLSLILLIAAPLSFGRLYHDNSNENYFVEHDPNLLSFNKLTDLFGDPEYLVVGVPARAEDSDVFSTSTIQMIAEITEFLEDHRHVTQVRSLSKYQYTHDDDGMMDTDDLFEDVDALTDEPQLLEKAREIMRGEVLALERLVTKDFQHTQIVARSTYIPGENTHKVELVHELQQFIAEKGYREDGHTLHLSGDPVIGERFETLTQRDMAWINPTMAVIILFILAFVFRSFSGTLAPLVVILSTMLLVTSLQGILKWPFTAVNSALIPTVIILSIGTAVHVLVEFFQFRRKGDDPIKAVQHTVADLFFAVLFTCITTSLGFIALSVTELAPVREFAVLAAVSPLIIFILCMTTFPAVLTFIREQPRGAVKDNSNSKVSQFLTFIPVFVSNKRRILAAAGFLLALFSFYGVSKITVDANIANYFKQGSWVNESLTYFNDKFKGISNLEIIVDTGEDGGVKNPEVLQRVAEMQAAFKPMKETGKPTSVIDFYKQINKALNEDDEAWFKLPTSREMAAQFLLLYENTGADEDLSDLKDFNDRFLRVQIPVINMDESKATALMRDINTMLAEDFSDLNTELTGGIVLNNAQNVYVNNGMFKSFGIAILVIGLCFILLFRSFKYGLIALIPSIVPILLTGGLVSMAGISMDLGTMIVGAMTIGIAVDDAIHLMSRYLLMRRRGNNVHDSIRYAMNTSGRAVLLTSLILVSGFSVMLLGSFVSYIYVGLFSAMIMSFALIGDLIFMPAMLYVVDDSPKKSSSNSDNTDISGEISHV